MQLGDKIRELRLQKQMTQKDVVGEFMTRNMLSKIENGSATPSIRTLEYLAEALGESAGYFLDGSAPEETLPSANITVQLDEIEVLAGKLQAGTTEQQSRCLSLCIRSRALMARGKTDAALSLLEDALLGEWPPEYAAFLYETAEDCCAHAGDFKQAYFYATQRLQLPR